MDAPFSLLIKPASADCNLRCAYCFYLEKAALYSASAQHRMSDAVLAQVIQSYMATPQPVYSFGWQGGEPTLMGLNFFRRVTALQQQHGRPGAVVANALQTNATLIDDAWAEYLAQFRFLVGCSLDGPAAIHDRYRRNAAGAPSHAETLRGIRALQAHQVEFNILTLVSQANVRQGREVYQYLRDEGHNYQQFIPCVEFDVQGRLEPFAITGAEWGQFLCDVFDAWVQADTRTISIRHHDSILNKIVDGRITQCTMGTQCGAYFLVEHNGDLFPCDFFVFPEYRLGNVMDPGFGWNALRQSESWRKFSAAKANWHADCRKCPHLALCAGDCLKHRVAGGRFDPRQLSVLCEGWQRFHTHTAAAFETLAADIRTQRRAAPALMPPPAGDRNAPCPCGSGLKYKKCCGRQ
jgi:uncharacterized protein